jgi:polyhydroxyalkanoate synthesis regulator phasin
MSEEKQGKREGFSEGVRQGLGVLSAFKEAIEETLSEVRERGDLSPDRARAAMKDALHRAQEVAGEARERVDFVSRKEFEAVKQRLDELWSRVEKEGGAGAPTEGEGGGGATTHP